MSFSKASMENKIKLFVLGLIISALIISGCTSSKQQEQEQLPSSPNEETPQQPEETPEQELTTIVIKDMKFTPSELTVEKGASVSFTNQDAVLHQIRTIDDSFTSDELVYRDTATFTFDKVGKINYYCGFHPSMKGIIIVE